MRTRRETIQKNQVISVWVLLCTACTEGREARGLWAVPLSGAGSRTAGKGGESHFWCVLSHYTFPCIMPQAAPVVVAVPHDGAWGDGRAGPALAEWSRACTRGFRFAFPIRGPRVSPCGELATKSRQWPAKGKAELRGSASPELGKGCPAAASPSTQRA